MPNKYLGFLFKVNKPLLNVVNCLSLLRTRFVQNDYTLCTKFGRFVTVHPLHVMNYICTLNLRGVYMYGKVYSHVGLFDMINYFKKRFSETIQPIVSTPQNNLRYDIWSIKFIIYYIINL